MTDASVPSDPPLDGAFASEGEVARRLRCLDWAATPLGPATVWPPELRASIALVLDARFPMVLLAGPQLVQIYNDAFAAMIGSTKDALALGRPLAEVWPELLDAVGPLVAEVTQAGRSVWIEDRPFSFERNLPREEVYITASLSPVRGADGRVASVLAICHETTARVVGERRLRLLRDLGTRLTGVRSGAEVCERAAAALSDVRSDLPYALLYLADPSLSGGRLAGAMGIEPEDPRVTHEFTIAGLRTADTFREALRTRRPQLVPGLRGYIGEMPGGPWPESPEVGVVAPLAAAGGPPIGFLVAGLSARRVIDAEFVTFIDLVASRIAKGVAAARAYEDEARRAEALLALDRAKTVFFGNVSHELRTPLALMLGPLADLRGASGVDDAHQRLLDVALHNGQRLTRLVDTLLDFSRIEAGKSDALFELLDLAALTADLASMFRATLERGGLTLRVATPPAPTPVWVDREMWEKVVLNLFSNAFKHTAAGEIAVTLESDGSHARLIVRDTGCGIPAAELPLIFERFHRVRSSWSRTLEGSGIGLALVRELVRLHGGTVEVASQVGVGTTFTVSLPLGHSHLPEAQRVTATRPRPTSALSEPFVNEARRWLPPGEAVVPPVPEDVTRARVLVVDDNSDMRTYLVRHLSQHWRVAAAADAGEALTLLERDLPDLVLCDVMMPDIDGFELLARLRADPRTEALPVILLSARAGEEAKVEGFESGADGYLVKPFSARELVARISGALQLARLRRDAAARQRLADERFRSLMLASHDIIWEHDLGSGQLEWNDELERQTGWTRRELATRVAWSGCIHPDEVEHVAHSLQHTLAGEAATWTDQYRVRTRTGAYRWFLDRALIVRGEDGRPLRMIGALVDVSERERLAEETRRAERLQAAGKLAGGMAHEVNNMMTAVLGFGDFVLRRLPDFAGGDTTIRSDIEQMVKAGERAAGVTKQLLAFTRRQVLQPTVLEVGQVVRELAPALGRLAGATIALELRLEAEAGLVRVDRTQLEQMLINLVHNARDAMPRGGTITIATDVSDGAPASGSDGEGLAPGRHVVLKVQDTGSGMDATTLRQAFEPFFTTKPVGQGTGLGLSTVYGTVRQSGGHIALESEVGRGTTVTIYLPAVAASHERPPERAPASPAGTEIVLVVEDEGVVRTIVSRALREKGFQVVAAVDGVDALAQLERHDGRFDLVLSDVVMPRMAGRELGEAVRARYPNLPIVFMSGYTGDDVVRRGLLEPDALFIQKPFTPQALAERLRAVLDRGRNPA
ncbi:MAG: response regulator [Myxococcota bacterium]